MSKAQALILMPLYNEAQTLELVLQEVRRYAASLAREMHVEADLLVVDDGSTDGSPQILERFPEVMVIRHPTNLGYGQSLIDGFHFAIRNGYEIVVTMDCDAQHEPQMIPRFITEIAGYDIVSGSRYLDPDAPGDPPPPDRRMLNEEITRILRELTGYPLTDAWCGFKAYRVEALRKLELTEPSYGMPLQVWIQAAAHNLRIKEIPVARIYKNPNRRFWGGLDDPSVRRAYYLRILEEEALRWLNRMPGGRGGS